MGNMNQRLSSIACAICMLSIACSITARAESSQQPTVESPLTAIVTTAVDAALDNLESTGNFDAAEQALTRLMDQIIAFAPENDVEALRIVALHRRLVQQLARADENSRLELLQFLRAHPRLAGAVAFLVKPEMQNPADVYALLNRLRADRAAQLENFATLTAAICVVHDRPLDMRVNENRPRADDPLRIFDYFAANESRMLFGIRNVPAELLMYVVDTTASIPEMNWALDRYAGHRNVGSLFSIIKYDHNHFRHGTEKAVTRAGFNLPNILQHGGVCADQTYFAMMVGKAIGVPTTYTRGRGADSSHAWIGFLQSDGRRAWWNFDVGRYEAYQGVRGNVRDPQTRRWIPDNKVSILADFSTTSENSRQRAAALHDAALRLRELATGQLPFRPQPIDGIEHPSDPLRQPDLESQLALIEQSLRNAAGYIPAWFSIRDMAVEGELSLEQKRDWANLVHRLCGDRYPYFHFEVIAPMIESVDDVQEQDRLWHRAFSGFRNRHDLAAAVRMRQASMWESQGDLRRAGQCYEDVIQRYANAGHFVVDALRETERILYTGGRPDLIAPLYEQAWRRTKRPGNMAHQFMRQSNWYRVGMRYAIVLEQYGYAQQAAGVRAQLGQR